MAGEGESSTLIIPAHNEARIIEESIRAVRAALAGCGRPWEILIVDDGSTDGTAERAAAALGDAGRVARLAPNRGKAGAIVAGVQACVTERLVFTDADLSVPPEFFEPAAAKLDAADVVIGSRHLPGSRLVRRQPWLRERCGETFRILVQRFFLPQITDFTCGLKGFRTAAARKLFDGLACLDWTFDVEVLLRAERAGLLIAEMPVSWINRPDSHVRLVSAIAGSLRSLWRLGSIYGWRR